MWQGRISARKRRSPVFEVPLTDRPSAPVPPVTQVEELAIPPVCRHVAERGFLSRQKTRIARRTRIEAIAVFEKTPLDGVVYLHHCRRFSIYTVVRWKVRKCSVGATVPDCILNPILVSRAEVQAERDSR